jgi:UDP-4-amino-4,6-dideoxy-N-acetyl-beta-L-altrosamine N-acetyltransferase
MIVHGFGIQLTRLRHEHIEMVRRKRNSRNISQYMEFREEITSEMQEKWFQSINNKFNNYFLIEFNGEQVGMIYGAQVDWEKKETGNGGIFIWEGKWMETPVPLASSLMLTETSFLLGLDRTYVKILKDNFRAISFNKNLGYEMLPGQEENYNQRYVLTKENYFKKAERFRHTYVKQYGDVFRIQIENPNDESEANIIDIYKQMTEENKKRFNLVMP